jgi:6-phosphogluconolactonase
MDIQTCPDIAALSRLAALAATETLAQAARARQRACLALSGGRTPEGMHRVLAGLDVAWHRVHVFWGDDRLADPLSPDSNFGMARRSLLDLAAIPEKNVHAVPWELPPEQAAQAYEKELRDFFGTEVIFDLTVLGMGPDGHVASLFPGRPGSLEAKRLVIAETEPGQPPKVPRISLTMPVLESSRCLMLLITGQAKLDLLHRARSGEAAALDLPIARLKPRGDFQVFWAP